MDYGFLKEAYYNLLYGVRALGTLIENWEEQGPGKGKAFKTKTQASMAWTERDGLWQKKQQRK